MVCANMQQVVTGYPTKPFKAWGKSDDMRQDETSIGQINLLPYG
jgi:hypothetical protein